MNGSFLLISGGVEWSGSGAGGGTGSGMERPISWHGSSVSRLIKRTEVPCLPAVEEKEEKLTLAKSQYFKRLNSVEGNIIATAVESGKTH